MLTDSSRSTGNRFVLYLAVLPFYRRACIDVLKSTLGDECQIFTGAHQLDNTVRTGIDSDHYTQVRNRSLASKFLLQTGGWRQAISADVTILDLNPRSITAWVLLLARKMLAKRTLLWGHLHPRSGAGSATAGLRRSMRRISDGTVLYGYDSVVPATHELPGRPVWVAPNSLYLEGEMRPAVGTGIASPRNILYVGRLVKEKKVDLLLQAFALSGLAADGGNLIFVGTGAEKERLTASAHSLGIHESVQFLGHEDRVEALREIYAGAACSVSPGYVGLSLTQSLGFGTPMVVSRDENHSPEIELARFGAVTYFETDSATSLADELTQAVARANVVDDSRTTLSSTVSQSYSAEAMASGLISAFTNTPQDLGDDGWPR